MPSFESVFLLLVFFAVLAHALEFYTALLRGVGVLAGRAFRRLFDRRPKSPAPAAFYPGHRP